MSAERGNANLARLLVAWESGAQKSVEESAQAFELLDVCGGALLHLNRAEAQRMIENRVPFDRDPMMVIPEDGRASVRVRCGQPVMVKQVSEELPGSTQRWVRMVKYGLCSRCSGWEVAIRQRLHEAAKKAAQETKTGKRGRRFDEDAAE